MSSYYVERLDDLLHKVNSIRNELTRTPQTEVEHRFQGDISEILMRLRGVNVAITDALQRALLEEHFNQMRKD